MIPIAAGARLPNNAQKTRTHEHNFTWNISNVHNGLAGKDRSQAAQANEMIEIERQVREAPAVCVICQYDEGSKRVHIAQFENESGKVLAYPGQDEFRRLLSENFVAVAAAVQDCYDEAEKQLRKKEKDERQS